MLRRLTAVYLEGCGAQVHLKPKMHPVLVSCRRRALSGLSSRLVAVLRACSEHPAGHDC